MMTIFLRTIEFVQAIAAHPNVATETTVRIVVLREQRVEADQTIVLFFVHILDESFQNLQVSFLLIRDAQHRTNR